MRMASLSPAPLSRVGWAGSVRSFMVLSYGSLGSMVDRLGRLLLMALVVLAALSGAANAQVDTRDNIKPIKLVAFGDSLTAGLGLPAASAFPAKLEAALRGKGTKVEVTNAGVSGDTVADGLVRLDWSIPQDAGSVIVQLRANDALRGP